MKMHLVASLFQRLDLMGESLKFEIKEMLVNIL